MNRRETILHNDSLRDQNRILEVVSVPRHERDQQVLTQRELAHVGRRSVGEYITAGDLIASFDERPLVNTGVLIRTRVLRKVVDIDTRLAGPCFIIVNADNDARGINRVNGTAAICNHCYTRIDGNSPFHAGSDQWRLGTQSRHSLALHIRAHQGAVGVVVLQEWNQRCRHRHDLPRRYVHIINSRRVGEREFVLVPHRYQVVDKTAEFIELRVRLCDHVLALLDRRQVFYLGGDLAAHYLPIWRLEEAVRIGSRIDGQ